jgi:hypothetical protein
LRIWEEDSSGHNLFAGHAAPAVQGVNAPASPPSLPVTLLWVQVPRCPARQPLRPPVDAPPDIPLSKEFMELFPRLQDLSKSKGVMFPLVHPDPF